MSYDFLLLPRDPGQSWDQVMEANERLALEEGDRALSPAARTRLEQIADRLQAHDSQLERLTTERYIELTRVDDAGIQLSLFSGQLAVSVAYWHTGSAAQAMMQIVRSYLAIMEQETGWEVYDRQLGRSLDRGHDLVEVTGWYAELSARLHRRFPQALQTVCPTTWTSSLRQGPSSASRAAVAVIVIAACQREGNPSGYRNAMFPCTRSPVPVTPCTRRCRTSVDTTPPERGNWKRRRGITDRSAGRPAIAL